MKPKTFFFFFFNPFLICTVGDSLIKDFERLTPNMPKRRRNLSLAYQVEMPFSALIQARFARLRGSQVALLAFPMAALLWKRPGELTGEKEKKLNK